MTDRSFVSGSIGELLAAVADGVREAQEALTDVPPLDAFGRPQPTYHIPFVDFEFQVDFETSSGGGGRLPLLFAKPASTEASIASLVKGRLVAVPPGEGRPLELVELVAERLSARRHRLRITAANSAGELLAGVTVEINLDAEASRALSEAAGAPIRSLRSTNVAAAALVTGADGTATTDLTIDGNLPSRALVMVTAEVGAGRANLALPAGNEP